MTPDNTANVKRTRDNIDAELSRTYFRGTPSFQAQQQTKNKEPKKKSTKIIIISILAILIVIAAALFLVIRNNVSFTVNVNLGDATESVIADGGISEVAETTISFPEKNSTVLFGFEKNDDNWEIPSWAAQKHDHIASDLVQTTVISSEGNGSIEIFADMPAKKWSGALIEIQQYLDLNGYDILAADIYLPSDAPTGLKGKIILTIGDEWRFVEMSWGKKLTPGEWTIVEADISDSSRDWKRTIVDSDFRSDIRKISVRVASDRNPAWSGNINIDNVRALVSATKQNSISDKSK